MFASDQQLVAATAEGGTERGVSSQGGLLRLFIVAEVRLYREGLAAVLDRHDGISVVGTAAHGENALDRIAELRPSVLLLDLATPSGREIIARVTERSPDTRVVVLALPETDGDVLAWAEAGVAGYVPKDGSLEELLGTVKCVARGETVASPRIVATLFRRVAVLAAQSAHAAETRLTVREVQILALIEEGLSNKEIAERLVIELATVKNHVHSILEKLKVRRRAEAAALMRTRTAARA